MKKILIHCGFSPFDNPTTRDLIKRKVKIGDNTGNFLFPNSLMRTFLDQDTVIVPNYYHFDYSDAEIEKLNAEYQMFLLPLADAFRAGNEFMLKGLTALIRKLKIPCVVVGVGLRAPYKQELEVYPFDDCVRDFVRAVLERSAILGLRGRFTGKYLEQLGFAPEKDFTVIGCPSLYTYGGGLQIRDPAKDVQHLSVNANTLEPDEVSEFINRCMDGIPDVTVVQQKYSEVSAVFLGGDHKNVYREGRYQQLIAEDRIRYFCSVPAWINYMKGIDLCVSSRFHGMVSAILAGTPSVIIPFDSRTRELAEYHNLTRISLDVLKKGTNPETLLAKADFRAPMKVSEENYSHYLWFLSQNGLKPAFSEDTASVYDKKAAKITWYQQEPNYVNSFVAERISRKIDCFCGKAVNKANQLIKRKEELL